MVYQSLPEYWKTKRKGKGTLMNSDEIDNIFRLMDRIMRQDFYGGYAINPSNHFNRYDNELDNPDEYNIDMNEDDEHIYFTVELRGVSDEDMNVTPKEKSIQLEIMAEGKWYKRNFRLLAEIVPEKSEISFNNYVLDVVLQKALEEE